jgi:hypothetical protein
MKYVSNVEGTTFGVARLCLVYKPGNPVEKHIQTIYKKKIQILSGKEYCVYIPSNVIALKILTELNVTSPTKIN